MFQTKTACAAVAAAILFAAPAAAQSIGSETTQTIIGSTVREEQAPAAETADRVAAAIARTPESIDKVRRTSALDEVEIVFLPDAAKAEGGPPPEIEAKLDEREDQIAELRREIEGNAMLFQAIESREVLARDVLAVEFPDDSRVVIYAAAKPPG